MKNKNEETAKEIFLSIKRKPTEEQTDDGILYFQSVDVGSFEVSIQASSFHYCTPKINLDNIADYESYEMAFMDNKSGWVNPSKDSRFCNFDWTKYFEKEGTFPVAKFVPKTDIIEVLCDIMTVTHRSMN